MEVTGIRFKKAGKIYYFENPYDNIVDDDDVIVETANGVELAKVVFVGKSVNEDEIVSPLKKIVRKATSKDYEVIEENKKLELDALEKCAKKVAEHKLDMKLIGCEYSFDKSKLLFYFSSDGRVDFRNLVRDLAGIFRTRIELRQVGVRDETKLMGAIGMCGRATCCYKHLSEFHPVSIKMAKNQNLSLNPTKISGVCGRLMCCLKYEEDTYKELNKGLPRVGDKVRILENGKIGEVAHINIIRQMLKIIIRQEDDVEIVKKKIGEIKVLKKNDRKK